VQYITGTAVGKEPMTFLTHVWWHVLPANESVTASHLKVGLEQNPRTVFVW